MTCGWRTARGGGCAGRAWRSGAGGTPAIWSAGRRRGEERVNLLGEIAGEEGDVVEGAEGDPLQAVDVVLCLPLGLRATQVQATVEAVTQEIVLKLAVVFDRPELAGDGHVEAGFFSCLAHGGLFNRLPFLDAAPGHEVVAAPVLIAMKQQDPAILDDDHTCTLSHGITALAQRLHTLRNLYPQQTQSQLELGECVGR